MSASSSARLAAIVFAIVALLQLVRAFSGLPISVGGTEIPVWPSWVLCAGTHGPHGDAQLSLAMEGPFWVAGRSTTLKSLVREQPFEIGGQKWCRWRGISKLKCKPSRRPMPRKFSCSTRPRFWAPRRRRARATRSPCPHTSVRGASASRSIIACRASASSTTLPMPTSCAHASARGHVRASARSSPSRPIWYRQRLVVRSMCASIGPSRQCEGGFRRWRGGSQKRIGLTLMPTPDRDARHEGRPVTGRAASPRAWPRPACALGSPWRSTAMACRSTGKRQSWHDMACRISRATLASWRSGCAYGSCP